MDKHRVAIARYEEKLNSVRKVIELSQVFEGLSGSEKVFVKPNVVWWNSTGNFAKWGVVTTSRVVEDTVAILKEHGISDITVGEGLITHDPRDKETFRHAAEELGYSNLSKRYGAKVVNSLEGPFEKVDLGDGVNLRFYAEAVHSDLVVSLPVLKTHSQTVLSLGIKNLKGLINIASRKKCHSPDPEKDLHFMISRIVRAFPRAVTIMDGIYTLERGPIWAGRPHRKNILVASSDMLSADLVGAKLLGYNPADVPHLVHAAEACGRTADLSGIEVVGERIEDLESYHEWRFPYVRNERGDVLPRALDKRGLKGVSLVEYDDTLCTYCSGVNYLMTAAIAASWQGEPWEDVEILTGKVMNPAPGRKKTVLVGQCMCNLHKNNPDITERIEVKGCPPQPKDVISALHRAGIMVNPALIESFDWYTGMLLTRYQAPEFAAEFDESFYSME